MSPVFKTKNTTICDMVFSVSQAIPLLPCFISEGSNISNENTILTYEGAWNCIKRHEDYLNGIISRVLIRNNNSSQDFVVAYLSGNSMDMLLSMLACSSLSDNSISASSSSPLSFPTTAATTAATTTTITTALLNTRWTAMEMAKSLQSKNNDNNNNNNTQNATTILLYGPGYETIAHDVIPKIGHTAYSFPIANIVSDFLQSPMQLSSSSSSLSTETVTTPPPTPPTPPIRQENITKMIQQTSIMGSTNDAFIIFTSGTTGGSKGVRLSHRALCIQALAKMDYPCGYCTETNMLASTVPLFHVGGLSSCLAVLFAGGKLYFPKQPQNQNQQPQSFSAPMVRQSLEASLFPVNTLVVVPAMLATYFSDEGNNNNHNNNNTQSSRRKIYDHVRLILVGGQSASDSMIENIKRSFPNARIVQTFACTEAASSLTFLNVHPPVPENEKENNNKELFTKKKAATTLPSSSSSSAVTKNADCVGYAPSHVHLRLYRKVKRGWNILSLPHEIGVIATRGPHVMNGYWERGNNNGKGGIMAMNASSSKRSNNNNDLSKTTTTDTTSISNDGWFLTTDLGAFDEYGRLYFCGRMKDVIRTGGETVFAQEVERILLKHPFVEACAVFPKQDDKFGEAVACAIVIKNNNGNNNNGSSSRSSNDEYLTLDILKEWCKENGLASYKRPRYLFLVNDLPRNSSGKVLKHQLVQMYGKSLLRSKL